MLGWIKDIAEIIIIILIIKFLLLPGLGYVLGVQEPAVAVMSESMVPILNQGDLVILHSSKNISIGDIIVFDNLQGKYIVHRVISLDPLQTKGDANPDQLGFERDINKSQVIGKVWFKIPYLGFPKVWFNSILDVISIS